MLQGYDKMVNFWNGKSAAERGQYIKDHYLNGNTFMPWKNMSMARLIKIIKRTKKGLLPRKYIIDRGGPGFINEYLWQRHAPRDTKAKSFQALLKAVLKTRNIPRQSYIEKTNDFADLLQQLDDLVPPELPKKGKKGKKGKKRSIKKKGTSRKGKKKGAPPPPEIEPFSDADDDDDGGDDGIGDAAADIAVLPAAASAAAAATADPLAPIADDDVLADVLGTDAPPAPKMKRKKKVYQPTKQYELRSRK